MTPQEFGRALVETGDLDPVYVGFRGAGMDYGQQRRWLLAYWCYYHTGAACWLSEQEGADYWGNMRFAAENLVEPHVISDTLPQGRWPRAPERRHFRGAKCVAAVDWLASHSMFGPERLVDSLWAGHEGTHGLSLRPLMSRVQAWPMFGPWVAFKAADMIDRCLGIPVNWPDDVGLIYSEPRSMLDMMALEDPSRNAVGHWRHLRDQMSPVLTPQGDRAVGPAECETICCKLKGYRAGRYWVGKDILEVHHATLGWGQTASRFNQALPKRIQQ